jgi:prepilin-type N-terminal cleavage/methylation domain-containing protein
MNPKVKSQRSKDNVLRLMFLQPAGFTLLEVLVASTILSLMLAALYGVFSQTLTSKKIAEERVSRSRAARLVLLRLGEELQSSFALSPLNARFVGRTHYEGLLPQARVSFVAALPTPLTAGGAAPSEIHYWLSPDPKQPRLFSLVRWGNLAIDVAESLPSSPPSLFSGPAAARQAEQDTFPLLGQVRGFRPRFFDGRQWREEWGQNEKGEKDGTQGRIPRAVEMLLYLDTGQASQTGQAGQAEYEGVVSFSTVVDLPLVDAPQVRRS